MIRTTTKKEGMSEFKNSQLLILSFIAALLFVALFLSPSMRPTYLYFVANFLIILLGAQAGLLSPVSRPRHGGSKTLNPQPSIDGTRVKDKPVEKSSTLERINLDVSFQLEKFKKCPSIPSLFFIGEIDGDAEAVVDEEDDDDDDEMGELLSGQELFAKAENFIGNFYKQLKMQKEESRNRNYEFYQKTF